MTARFPEIIEFPLLPPPPLATDQLHLMVASLDSLAQYREQAYAAINSDEQARAERFINATHGDNFRIVRGALRLCLSSYLHQPAAAIRFDFNEYGKPEINSEQNPLALQFNVSHSQHMAAFCFSRGVKVGIDIEFKKPLKNVPGLAQHVCSPKELDEFNAMAPAQQQDAFFRLWTRKEAFIKAKGQGLSMGLRSIYIGFETARPSRRIQYRGEWLDNWLVKDVPCDGAYKLAVAMEI